MDSMQQLDQTLNELCRITGLPLNLTLTDEMDPEVVQQQLLALCNTYREANNREVVLRRYLLQLITQDEFYTSASRMHMHLNSTWALFLIQLNHDICEEAITVLKNLYPDTYSMVFSIRQDQIVVAREIPDPKKLNIKERAYEMVNALNSELMVNAIIAYGKLAAGLEELSQIFQEAELTLQIGSIFFPDRTVLSYNELGVGSLIYALPKETCQKYIIHNLEERFLTDGSIFFENEILETADCFLRCNLNIAETARQIHVHRNTLLYRLEQIQNETGLDIRNFQSAMTFKLCSLILHYLKETN